MKKTTKLNGFWTGLLCGLALWGLVPTVEATTQWVQAKLTQNEIFLDGKKVDWTVYNIGNQNYIRLADLCPEIGVGLAWDSVTDQVLMNSDGSTPQVTQVTVQNPTTSQSGSATVTYPNTSSNSSNGVITIPEGDAKLNLKVGDKVLCDDGHVMEIVDMSRYENNSFQTYDKLPDLPSQQGDWSNLPVLDSPEVQVKHFSNDHTGTETVFITNVYEMRRMQYTMYNIIANTSKCWNGTTPLSTVGFGMTSDSGVSPMWPWKEDEFVEWFSSSPNGNHQVEAFDYYVDGVFQYTRYLVRGW